MEMIVLGSSSKGNGYIFKHKDSCIIIDAGVPLKEVKKALDFNLEPIEGLLLTHSHQDHCKYIEEYVRAGIPVYGHETTMTQLQLTHHPNFGVNALQYYRVGEWHFKAFEVVHDVACLGYMVINPSHHSFCFVTDTHYCPYKFKDLQNIIIECNYSDEILEARGIRGSLPSVVQNRVVQSHMSLETCKKFLQSCDLTHVNNIVLIHLSDGNSDAEYFKSEISNLTGKTVHVADKGMTIHLGATPY